jgi:hypothetical protein
MAGRYHPPSRAGACAAHLGWAWELHRYDGPDFEGIFAGLGDGR